MNAAARMGLLFAVLSAVSFGFYPAAARYAYAEGANASFMMLLTTGTRMLAFWIFCRLAGKKLFADRPALKSGIVGGFFQAVTVGCIFASLLYIPGPVMIIIVFTHTLMLLLFMAWKREVRLDAATLLTTLAALLGLSFVLDLWSAYHSYSPLGMVLAFVAALATGTRLYVYGREMKTRNPAVVGAENFIFAVVFLLPVAAVMTPVGPGNFTGYCFALLAGLTQAAATFSMFYGIQALGAFRFSLFLKLEPVFTALFSIVLLHEVLAWHQYAGIAAVLASLVTYQYIETRRHNAVPAPRVAAE